MNGIFFQRLGMQKRCAMTIRLVLESLFGSTSAPRANSLAATSKPTYSRNRASLSNLAENATTTFSTKSFPDENQNWWKSCSSPMTHTIILPFHRFFAIGSVRNFRPRANFSRSNWLSKLSTPSDRARHCETGDEHFWDMRALSRREKTSQDHFESANVFAQLDEFYQMVYSIWIVSLISKNLLVV